MTGHECVCYWSVWSSGASLAVVADKFGQIGLGSPPCKDIV